MKLINKEKEERNYLMDKIKRKSIIEEVLFIAFGDNIIPLNKINNVKEFYICHYEKYLGKYIDICSEPYSYGDFCFNDVGFQFKWKNHNRIIQLECISWDEVKRQLALILKG